MQVTGKVTKVYRYGTDHGSRYTKLHIETASGNEVRLTYLQTFSPIPDKGDHITIEGMPIMTTPRRGQRRTNIGAVKVTISDKGGQTS
jgi:hypothetical protein